jgi:hypothetical protein
MLFGISTALSGVKNAVSTIVKDGLKLFYNFTNYTPDILLDGATSFDGTNDTITITDDDSLTLSGGFTFSAWVYAKDKQYFVIFSKGAYNSNWAYTFRTSDVGKIELFIANGSTGFYTITGTTAISENEWNHLVVTYDGNTSPNTSNFSFYINGVSDTVASASLSNSFSGIPNTTANLVFGNYASQYAEGFMANVGIWNRVLSSSEVESIYWKRSYSELEDTELTNLVSWYDLKSTTQGEKFTIASAVSDSNGNETDSLGNFEAVSSPSLFEVSGTGKSDTTNNVGNYAIKTTGGGDGKGLRDLTLVDGGLTIGASYTLSFDYKMASGIVQFILQKGTSAGGIANTYNGLNSTSWASYSITFTATETDVRFYLYQYGSTSATWYFDNLSLKEVQTPDSVGTNNGAIVGATTLTDSYSANSIFKPRIQDYAKPKTAQQLSDGSTDFDGTDDYIAITSQTLSGAFTISMWIKPGDVTDRNLLGHSSSSSNFLYIDSNSDVVLSSSNLSITFSNADLSSNQWQYITITRDESDVPKFYKNGSLTDTNSADAGTFTFNQIGRYYDGSVVYDGSMANVGIWTRALTQSEIQEVMFSEKYAGLSASSKTNLVSWYDLGDTKTLPAFNGSNNFIKGGNLNISSGSWSFSYWVYHNNIGSTMGHILKPANEGAWSGDLSRLLIRSVSGKLLGSIGAYSNLSQTGSTVFSANTWHNVVATLDSTSNSSNFKIYVDNSLKVTLDSASITNSDTTMNYGTNYGIVDGSAEMLNGFMHNISWVDSVLTSSERTSIYNLGKDGDFRTIKTPTNYYNHNISAWASGSNNITDISGSLNGTLQGSSQTLTPYKAPDSAGSNNGTIVGATTNTGYTSAPHGVTDPLNYGTIYSGTALSFDGTNDYVVCNNPNNFSSSIFTLSAWVKPSVVNANQVVIAYGSDTSSSPEGKRIALFIASSSKPILAFWGNDVVSDGTINAGIWTHLAITFSGGDRTSANSKIYINSVSQTLTGGTASALDLSDMDFIHIGADQLGSQLMNGSISNVKIFDTDLTQAQVRELYLSPEKTLPTGVSSSALKLDMPMQEGSGTVVHDGSPVIIDIATNGDFSADSVGSTSITGWSLSSCTAEIIADGYSGNAVKITRTGDGSQYIYQDISGVVSGNQYKVTAYARLDEVYTGSEGTQPGFNLRTTTPTYSNPSQSSAVLPIDASWKQYTHSFTAQGTTARIELQRVEGDPGSIRIDSVAIEQLEVGQNHGTISGATWVYGNSDGYQNALVRSNKPIIFDGSNDAITTGIAGRFKDATEMSLSIWIYPTHSSASGTTYHSLINEWNSNGGKMSWGVWLMTPNNSTDAHIHFNDGASNFNTSSAFVSVNKWHHISLTRNGTAILVYHNGVLAHTGTSSATSPNDYDGELTIGAQDNGAVAFYKGLLNEVAVWDKTLTANEISAIYNNGLPINLTANSGNYTSSDGLQGYWRNNGVTTWTDIANTGVANFDGTNDYVNIDDNFNTTFIDSFTISAWLKPSDGQPSSAQTIMGTAKYDTYSGYLFLRLEDGGQLRVIHGTHSGKEFNKTSSVVFSDGENSWKHCVFIFTKASDTTGTMKIYANGVEVLNDSSPGTGWNLANYTNTYNLFIGARNQTGTANQFYSGQISGVSIWNTALSSTQISELYNIDKRSSISGHSKFSNCIGSWLMGAGTGDTTSTIQDQTSSNNDGTVVGASLVGYNNGTASGSPASALIPESNLTDTYISGSTYVDRDSQGFFLNDTSKVENGIKLNGNEYVEVGDSEVLSVTGDKTIECWIKKSVQNANNGIMGKGGANGNTGYFFFSLNNGKVRFNVDQKDGTTSNVDSANALWDGNWHHIVGVYTAGTNVKIYVDGSLSGTSTTDIESESLNASGKFYIGKEQDGYKFTGEIDEPRFYDKALSSDEVTKNYKRGLGKHS